MKTPTHVVPATLGALVKAGLLSLSLAALAPALHLAHAQPPGTPPMALERAARLHAEGLAMERRDDDKGAFIAFDEAANGGYGPSQRKLGELYDHGTPAVPRDYELSIRWYDRARESGEDIPSPRSRLPGLDFGH